MFIFSYSYGCTILSVWGGGPGTGHFLCLCFPTHMDGPFWGGGLGLDREVPTRQHLAVSDSTGRSSLLTAFSYVRLNREVLPPDSILLCQTQQGGPTQQHLYIAIKPGLPYFVDISDRVVMQ